jgi:hypothetical protein
MCSVLGSKSPEISFIVFRTLVMLNNELISSPRLVCNYLLWFRIQVLKVKGKAFPLQVYGTQRVLGL